MVTCAKGMPRYDFFLLKFKNFLAIVLWHPRHCRRYTCRDRSVKHLVSSDVIDQSVCRMLRNHIGHICNVCQMVPNVNVVDMVRENILWKLVILKYKVCKSSCGRQKIQMTCFLLSGKCRKNKLCGLSEAEADHLKKKVLK